jgi:hypothetical protein
MAEKIGAGFVTVAGVMAAFWLSQVNAPPWLVATTALTFFAIGVAILVFPRSYQERKGQLALGAAFIGIVGLILIVFIRGGFERGFELSVDGVAIGRSEQYPGSSGLLVVARLKNHGEPSIAEHFRLKITVPNGPSRSGAPTVAVPERIIGKAPDGSVRTYFGSDSLIDKVATKPIEKGSQEVGILLFAIRPAMPNVGPIGMEYELSCQNVRGEKSYGKFIVGTGTVPADKLPFFPGLRR